MVPNCIERLTRSAKNVTILAVNILFNNPWIVTPIQDSTLKCNNSSFIDSRQYIEEVPMKMLVILAQNITKTGIVGHVLDLWSLFWSALIPVTKILLQLVPV